jgi:hypothetical protein
MRRFTALAFQITMLALPVAACHPGTAMPSTRLPPMGGPMGMGSGNTPPVGGGTGTPLVVAFAGEPVTFTQGGAFAFSAGVSTPSDWPTATTPWIALDRDGDGAITSGAELFGSSTVLADGRTATNGFEALAALDANHDGVIDAKDPLFASLLLWSDRDGDRRSSPDELVPLASRIVSISLDDHVVARCDARNNCERERAPMRWRDDAGAVHVGAVIDVYLPTR